MEKWLGVSLFVHVRHASTVQIAYFDYALNLLRHEECFHFVHRHLLVEEDIMTEPLVEADNLYRISTVKSSFQGLKHLPARPVYSPISADEIRDVIAHVRQVATVVTRK